MLTGKSGNLQGNRWIADCISSRSPGAGFMNRARAHEMPCATCSSTTLPRRGLRERPAYAGTKRPPASCGSCSETEEALRVSSSRKLTEPISEPSDVWVRSGREEKSSELTRTCKVTAIHYQHSRRY